MRATERNGVRNGFAFRGGGRGGGTGVDLEYFLAGCPHDFSRRAAKPQQKTPAVASRLRSSCYRKIIIEKKREKTAFTWLETHPERA